jgi:hypothetical protein
VRGSDIVGQLDRALLALVQEDDPDHRVRLLVGDDQRRPEAAFGGPASLELLESPDGLVAATRCRDRHPDRLGDVRVVAVPNERVNIMVPREAHDDRAASGSSPPSSNSGLQRDEQPNLRTSRPFAILWRPAVDEYVRLGSQRVDGGVDLVGNDNIGCASPVHHRHSIWRCSAAALSETKPHS